MQELKWRVVNRDTGEIMESDSLGVILNAVKSDLSFGEKLHDMTFYHIEKPDEKISLQTHLDKYNQAITAIKLAVKTKDIPEIKHLVSDFRKTFRLDKQS